MTDPAPSLDPQLRAPLAGFQGERPAAPAWFERALAQAPERSFTEVDGARIETLVWGELGRPGLLLIHGGGAHADWWAHVAPYLAEGRRVAALSLSGAGLSDRRERYTMGQYARELVGVARAAGLYAAGPPVFAGHSFGSRPLYLAAADPELAPKAAVVVDAAIARPGNQDVPSAGARMAAFASFETALARFRLMPPQPCENLFLVDYIGRHSIRPLTPEEGEGWTWRFDPLLWERLSGGNREVLAAALQAVRCPLAYVYGERSYIVGNGNLNFTRALAPAEAPFVAIPDAAHHVFLDQPLAFVAALRGVLAYLER